MKLSVDTKIVNEVENMGADQRTTYTEMVFASKYGSNIQRNSCSASSSCSMKYANRPL